MLASFGGERRVAVEREAEADYGGARTGTVETLASDGSGATVPVAREQLHGAAVHADRYLGPFMLPPSERTRRQERAPPAWPAREMRQIPMHVRFEVSRRSVPAPAPEASFVPRPATAGDRAHRPPTWWLADAKGSERWTDPTAGSRAAERPRWAPHEHNLKHSFVRKAEVLRGKRRAVQHMPAFLKPRDPPPDGLEEWTRPAPPPPVANPVYGPNFGKVLKLSNIQGKRWQENYANFNYHGKGVYVGRLLQDRLGNPCEFF